MAAVHVIGQRSREAGGNDPLGLISAAWLAVRFGLADLPKCVNWHQMLGAGVLAGIGFTMSLFIASLAFVKPEILATAKLSILIASVLAGGVGMLLFMRAPARREAALPQAEA